MTPSEPKKKFVLKHSKVVAAEKNAFNWISFTTQVSAFVPILYVIGRSHHIYYLDTYGINAEFFPRSTPDYLFLALMAVWSVIYQWVVSIDLLMPLLWAGGISIYLAFLLWFEQSKLRPWIKEKGRYLIFSRSARVVGVISFGPILVSVTAMIVIFLLVFLALPIVIGLNSGQRIALDEIKQDKGRCEYPSARDSAACTVVSKNGVELLTGRVIAVSDAIVAIAADGNVVVLDRGGVELRVKK